MAGALLSLPPLAPCGGTPLRGALLFPRGKSNQKDAQGEARRTDASRPQAGPPPENPLVLRGCSIRGILFGFPARGAGMYSPLFLLPPICRHCNRVGSTDCASCGGPYTPRWGLARLPIVAGKLKHFSSAKHLQAGASARRKAMSGAIQAFSGEAKIISTQPMQAPVGRKTKGNPSAKPLKPEPHLRIKSGVPLPLTGDS